MYPAFVETGTPESTEGSPFLLRRQRTFFRFFDVSNSDSCVREKLLRRVGDNLPLVGGIHIELDLLIEWEDLDEGGGRGKFIVVPQQMGILYDPMPFTYARSELKRGGPLFLGSPSYQIGGGLPASRRDNLLLQSITPIAVRPRAAGCLRGWRSCFYAERSSRSCLPVRAFSTARPSGTPQPCMHPPLTIIKRRK